MKKTPRSLESISRLILIAIMTMILRYRRRHDAYICVYKASLLCNNNFYRESFAAVKIPLTNHGSNGIFARVFRLSGLTRPESFVIEIHDTEIVARLHHRHPPVSARAMTLHFPNGGSSRFVRRCRI